LRREQAEWTGEYVDAHVQDALAWSKKTYGHQVHALSAADAESVKTLLKPITEDYVKRVSALGLPADKIVRRTSGKGSNRIRRWGWNDYPSCSGRSS
ncbi:MAG: C4-dicarboxylate transporter substrate-binding protein, partial [Deltaproteobacteria bacterium]|nr:C4-dicarboxylate transporter substrate-binding protein [Deltaproteobacteria bacterium]